MTIIVAKKEKNEIIISSDSQVSWGRNKTLDGNKIFEVNGLFFATSGLLSESNLLKNFSQTHKPKYANEDAVLEFFAEFAEYKQKFVSTKELENHNFLVFEKRIFSIIEIDVKEIETFSALGSGMFLALGALELGATTEKAVDVAKKYDLYCGGETKTIKIKL